VIGLFTAILPGARWAIYAGIAGLAIGGYAVHRFHTYLDDIAENRSHEQVIASLVRENQELRKFEEKYERERRNRQSADRALKDALAARPITQFDREPVPADAVRLLNEARQRGATEASVRSAAGLPDAEGGGAAVAPARN
jgi:hypothetical protein